ncbi:hypothetical protein [Opitutus terrae]|uniref:Uncharacterized protein n=1 Tax=Opitutus terrae (strain DSM 11246 / JCM 15787 / PB90-1) TaxID=452637 RepID=B1ZQB0_OPITP|nr:hypothetical protein [Opitutus terrae]ACB73590.1 hypothetical protein Oter_0300 [Opitutus terrae PB90-1]
MNREEAQFILGAYRPNSEDAQDPQFQEALTLARRDPGLGHWFAEQQAIDRILAAKVRARPIPPQLKTQLLLARATGACQPRWRRPVWLAVAACAALLFVAAGTLLSRRVHAARLAEFRSAMVAASLERRNHADVEGLDAQGYQHWLVAHRGDPDFVLPPRLAERGISACKVVEWRQSRVTMLCFQFSGGHVDVFVVNAADLPRLPLGPTPALFADGKVTSAAWRHEGKIYLAASAMPSADLQKLL